MHHVNTFVLSILLSVSILFSAYIVGTSNNIEMNQIAANSAHNVIAMI